jgi:tetratricopeptide (TPR) repeat protein
VTSLVDKSLLQRAVEARAEIRFSMLVTIREFALTQLRNMGRETEAWDRYLDYFLALAEEADRQVHGPDQLEWINKLEAEHDNFRSAFEWSLSVNQTENAVRLFNSVHWAWYVRCHYSELAEWFEEIINLPDIEQFPLQRARALTNAGSTEWSQGKFAEARSHLTQSKAICMELGLEGEVDLAWALTWLAQVTRIEGTELAEAAVLAKDGLQFYQKWGNKIGEAFCTLILGAIQTEQNLPSTQQTLAKQTVEHSLELFNQLGDSWGIARVSGYLGVVSLNAGDLEKAQTYFEQQLLLDEKLDFKDGIAVAFNNLAQAHLVRGDFIQARQTFQNSIQIAQEIAKEFSSSLYGLCMTALAENDYASALKLFKELFDHERNQYRQMIACDFLMGLSAVSAGLDQPERSAKLYGAAQAIMNITDYKYSAYDRAEFERHIQLARQRLAESFEPFVQAGRAMTMEQAIDYALAINE